MATNPDALFADLIPGAHGATAPVYGAPAADKSKDAPSGYRFRPDGSLEPIPGGPADPNKDVPTVGASQVTGGAYLKTLDPGTASLVQALAEGRKSFPSGSALRSPYWQQMLTHVSNYDPGFDEVNYTSRAATRRDFTSGKAANNIRALNTAIGHLGHLEEQVSGTASHGFVPLNTVENFALRATGDPGPTNFDATVSALAGELTAVYRGAGGAEADINRYIQQLSPNASKEQKEGTIRNIVGLLKSRLDALNDQYRQGMGTTAQQLQLLDPQAQLIVHNLGGFDAAGAPEGGAGPGGPSGGGSGGGDGPLGSGQLTPDQQAKDKAFLATNPTPEQYTAFLSGLTGKQADPKAAAARLKAAQEGGAYSGATLDPTEQQKVDARIAEENKLGLNENPAEVLTKQGATLNLSDEAAGVGNALSNVITSPFTGKFDPVGSYTLGRDVERQRIANAREQLGYGGSALEFAGALASANPEGALATLAPKATAVAAGKAGAAGGALSGFGAGEGAQQSLTGAGVGGTAGFALGRYGPGALQKVLPRRFQPPQGMAPDLADAARAENVDLIRPMVDPASRPKFGALESDPTAQPIVRGGAERVRGQIEDRTAALGGTGTPLEPDAAGSLVQNAGRRFIQRSRGVANTLYNRARSIAGDARFVPQNAIDQVEAEVAALQKNPETNAGEIKFLEGLHSDLATPGGKTVEELRQLRTSLRGRVNEQNLGATQAEARAMRAMDATQQDVAQNVPDAATAYQRADTYYRERQTHIDDVIKRITGGNVGGTDYQVSGEQAFQRLKSMTSPGGDGRRLAALMRDLEPNERQDIAATIAQQIGRRAPDEPFSTALFVSQTRKLSPSARRTIFGPDGAQSIENLRLLSQKLTEAGGDINRSRSTTVANRMSPIRTAAKAFIAGITGLGPAAGGFAVGGAEGGAIGLAGGAASMAGAKGLKALSARAMVNPRVSRWLAESADASTPAAAKEATRKLGVIIAREPALAHELQPIYSALNDRLSLPLAANSDQRPEANNEQQ